MRIAFSVMVLMSALVFMGVAACSAPATPTPGAPAAAPDIGATVEARVRVELGSAATTRAAWPTALPSPAPAAAATPDIEATVQAAVAEAMPTATPALAPIPAATATPAPVPTATPTWMEWLHQGLGRTRCADPGHEIRYDNLNTTPPYSADIYCVAPAPTATAAPVATATPTPTPSPTATPLPTARPTRRPTATPHPTPTLLPTATPRPARIPQDRGSRLAGITVLIISSDSLGTGFFAVTEAEGRYYVFTNDHVVGDDGAVDVYWHLARETLTATVLRSNAHLDIAILDLQPSDFGSYPGGWGGFSYGTDNYDKGDAVWIAGYYSDMGDTYGKAPVVRDGTIYQKRLQGGYGGITSLLEHSVDTAPGSSGSPIVNSSDEIIAINMGADRDAERIGLGVPLWVIYIWWETGDDSSGSSERGDVLRQSDGVYWAVLTWEEDGEWRAMSTPEDNYCITQIWETELEDGRKRYRWQDLCGNGLEGYIGGDGEVYFEYLGRVYYATRVRVSERPG